MEAVYYNGVSPTACPTIIHANRVSQIRDFKIANLPIPQYGDDEVLVKGASTDMGR